MDHNATSTATDEADRSIRSIDHDSDTETVVSLLRDVMGWDDDTRTNDFFAWKHHHNPFGRSHGWVGLDADGEVVAVRLMMRWRFAAPGGLIETVRAVDTATHPGQQGRGWFTRLTMRAVDDLSAAGVGFVFNTPNDKSRPGYLKMGWTDAVRPALQLRLSGPRSVPKLRGARVAADKWARPVGAAPTAGELLARHGDAVDRLLASCAPETCATERSAEYLQWRYGLGALGYQAMTLDDDVSQGMVIHRARRRGSAIETSICELFVPDGSRRTGRELVKRALRDSRGDVAVGIGLPSSTRMVPVPRLGPQVTTRRLAAEPQLPRFSLGDLELF